MKSRPRTRALYIEKTSYIDPTGPVFGVSPETMTAAQHTLACGQHGHDSDHDSVERRLGTGSPCRDRPAAHPGEEFHELSIWPNDWLYLRNSAIGTDAALAPRHLLFCPADGEELRASEFHPRRCAPKSWQSSWNFCLRHWPSIAGFRARVRRPDGRSFLSTPIPRDEQSPHVCRLVLR
jgi:hypothetical protein